MKKVWKFSSLKIVGRNIWPGICYLQNLLNGFQNPARKSASCYIETFPANSDENLLDLAASMLKWQHCLWAFDGPITCRSLICKITRFFMELCQKRCKCWRKDFKRFNENCVLLSLKSVLVTNPCISSLFRLPSLVNSTPRYLNFSTFCKKIIC